MDLLYEKLVGHWIIEMSEMIGAIKAENIESLKSFLSQQKDTYRIPYNRYVADWPRQCVFGGTSNSKYFLPFDRSSARRFLTIEVHPESAQKHLLDNEEESRAEIDQAWAEVMHLYKHGEYSMIFPAEIQTQLDSYRSQFMLEDTLAGQIQSWLDNYTGDYVCSKLIWEEAMGRDEGEV